MNTLTTSQKFAKSLTDVSDSEYRRQIAYNSIYDYRFTDGEYLMISEEHLALQATETVSLPNTTTIYKYGFTVELPNQFLMSCNGSYLTIPNFTMYEKLFKWHFNVFDLPENLFVNYNDI